LGSRGLLTADQAATIRDFQLDYARPAGETDGWAKEGIPTLADVVREVQPTVLIGTSAQAASFSEEIVREMGAHCPRPIILPLSNPTSKCEALPADLLRWTDGRALIATGSPFAPVEHNGQVHRIAQANNALVFPGLGLGVIAARARRVSTGMLTAAAQAVAALPGDADTGLLPPVTDLRAVSAAVALAVAAAAEREGLADAPLTDPERQINDLMWLPAYPDIEAV
jgi:malate dehydrogenase (oxaloacetate-decarboxylating)